MNYLIVAFRYTASHIERAAAAAYRRFVPSLAGPSPIENWKNSNMIIYCVRSLAANGWQDAWRAKQRPAFVLSESQVQACV